MFSFLEKTFSIFNGYKTYGAALGLFMVAVVNGINLFYPLPADVVVLFDHLKTFFQGLGLIGVGHKIEKNA